MARWAIVDLHRSFVGPSSASIREALGVEVFFALSDLPWSFRVVAGTGERVGVWVSEEPDTTVVTVVIEHDAGVLYRTELVGARRLAVAREAPEIVCEFGDPGTSGRLSIALFPALHIDERVGPT